uniref:Uncharacterized protein n=1 Tax=Utricularia reniformis TaxID=192314 RepID=A0A1Y0B3A3_9LAMI|nr:hypothetical protein AEK19_MT1701 [Utricularia reniformis]ART31881.1 hypothetical protein AEK19_MT1701 [Utricularia reniformis]
MSPAKKTTLVSSNSMISVTWLSRSLATSACCAKEVRKERCIYWFNYREQFGLDAMVAEIKITKPVLCLALRKAPPNQAAMLSLVLQENLAIGHVTSRTMSQRSYVNCVDCLDKIGSPEHQVQLDTLNKGLTQYESFMPVIVTPQLTAPPSATQYRN